MIRKLRKRGRVRMIGGGISGKPPVAVFLDREFDSTHTREPSLADISPLAPEQQRNLKVYPGIRVPKPFRKDMPSIAGDVWVDMSTGKRFVATSVMSKNYLYSPGLKDIVGKPYVHPDCCRRVIRNEGIVVWEQPPLIPALTDGDFLAAQVK